MRHCAGIVVLRSGGNAARLTALRSYAASAGHAGKSRGWRSLFGTLGLGAVAVGGWKSWKLTQSVTPIDAEALALEYEKNRVEELAQIGTKRKKRRVVELLLLLIPVALASPLWILSPTLFWKIVALQIDRSGPCFIKLAQWLSTRRDIFSDELCECLSVMHESVEAAWSTNVSPKDIKRKLANSDLQLKQLDDEAVASGSIAQVYFGELEDGTQVAVKCLRPSVREMLEGDLAWMLYLGERVGKQPMFAMLGLRRAAEDFCEHVQMQVDFEIEASNLRRFRKNFAESGECVVFPSPLYCAKDILVLTRERGDNLAQIFRAADGVASKRPALVRVPIWAPMSALAPVAEPELQGAAEEQKARYCSDQEKSILTARSSDIQEALGVPARTTRKVCAEILAAYMRMVFKDAFVHGDLHPGNMMLRLNEGAFGDDSERNSHVGGWKKQVISMLRDASHILPESIRPRFAGLDDQPPFQLVLLDAGLSIPIAPKRVEALRSMAISMLYCDFYGSASHIYNQSPDSSKCTDPEAFKQSLANVFRGVRKNAKQEGYVQVSDACLECLRLVRHHQVPLDTGLTWALFAMLSAEGCARQLDPEADCTGAAARYIVTVPSLIREMNNQSPDIIRQMAREIIFGRRTHKKAAVTND